MLDKKQHFSYDIRATCDVCGNKSESYENLHGDADARRELEDLGWLFATLEVDHWRYWIAICPSCSASFGWLKKLLQDMSAPARRRGQGF